MSERFAYRTPVAHTAVDSSRLLIVTLLLTPASHAVETEAFGRAGTLVPGLGPEKLSADGAPFDPFHFRTVKGRDEAVQVSVQLDADDPFTVAINESRCTGPQEHSPNRLQ